MTTFSSSGQFLSYKGSPYSFKFFPGRYLFELWGASGGGKNPGFGAYVSGTLYLKTAKKLHIYIGQKGVNGNNIAWNGGGRGTTHGSSGGGATDIRTVDGEWDDFESLKSRIIVAGAGGGSQQSSYLKKAGDAGILSGYDGDRTGNTVTIAEGGKQATEAKAGTGTWSGVNGKFGKGGQGSVNNGNGNGGGSGYFGGGGGATSYLVVGSGAGGSSYISGMDKCKAILSSSTESNPLFSESSIHSSGLFFVKIAAKDGSDTKWDGDGKARITIQEYKTSHLKRNSLESFIFWLILIETK